MTVYMKQGDLLPLMTSILKIDNTPVDLTNATGVQFVMSLAATSADKVNRAASITSPPTAGSVSYSWVTGDTDTPGDYRAEWQVTWAGGKVQTFPGDGYISITVLPKLV